MLYHQLWVFCSFAACFGLGELSDRLNWYVGRREARVGKGCFFPLRSGWWCPCKGLLGIPCSAKSLLQTGVIPTLIPLVSCSLAAFVMFSEPRFISSILGTKPKCLGEDYSHLQLSQQSEGESRHLQRLILLMDSYLCVDNKGAWISVRIAEMLWV